MLRTAIDELGGLHNAHLHLDRAGTFDDSYLRPAAQALASANISLQEKHGLIHQLHGSHAYDPVDLRRRVDAVLDAMTSVGTRVAETLVDVTADEVGLGALETLQEIQRERAGSITLRIGAYSPFGFTDAEPARWEVFVEGARRADLLGCLPEADDLAAHPTHIGFREHCRRMLSLAEELGKPVQVHVDQRNEPAETGTEDLIAVARELGMRGRPGAEPQLWAVHAISPSTYDDARFDAVVDGLIECGIGVITCPSAALGMRMFRPILTPTYNSIPRVLDLLARGVQVRIGSDNIADICSPSTTPDLVDEVFVLSAALRFYDVAILAKLAAGAALDDQDRESLQAHIGTNDGYLSDYLAGA